MKRYRIRKNSIADITRKVCEMAIVSALTFGLVLFSACEYDETHEEPIEEAPPITVEEITVEKPYIYDVPLAAELQLHIVLLCEDYHIDPALVLAMISVESNYDAEAIGDGGDSVGLMQIQEKWHKERMARLGATDLMNPYQNVLVGIDYLAEKLNEEQGLEWALMAYNGGDKYANEMTAAGKVSNYACKVGLEAYKLTAERNEQ